MFFRAFFLNKTTVLVGQNEGLPNITGGYSNASSSYMNNQTTTNWTGCFYGGANSAHAFLQSGGSGKAQQSTNFDASLSNGIYGNSNHVTPFNATIKVWQRVS